MHEQTAANPAQALGDLFIVLDSAESRYYGTREQLTAEGLVPDGIDWPSMGFSWRCWRAHGMVFKLLRTRPPQVERGEGRNSYASADYWRLEFYPEEVPAHVRYDQHKAAHERMMKARAMAMALNDAKPWKDHPWHLARTDERFQALMRPMLPQRGWR
ncbi:hypothetical protein [uncultured Pseudacidovorax sp.]|uniref:hypothetical protein n=1 Tax=uncultured Pseudacidovorax sp. TaxID=679313 RepID=UPI0025EE7BAF|nr:hypothetical protein [uncultured Pseudacidovorax sp.]